MAGNIWEKWNRLKVVNVNGAGINGKHAFIRIAMKFVPWKISHVWIRMMIIIPRGLFYTVIAGFILSWLLVGANIISILINPTRQALYDRLTGTYVVQDQT